MVGLRMLTQAMLLQRVIMQQSTMLYGINVSRWSFQQSGDAISMAKVVFYSVLCSLDVMSEISAVDYSNLPVVSTEPVKFLLLNTQVEAVDKLEEKTGELSDFFRKIIRTVANNVMGAHTAENKHDKLKKAEDTMRCWLEKWFCFTPPLIYGLGNSSTRELEKVSYSQQYGATVTVKTLLVETPVEGKQNCQGVLSRKNRVEVEVRGRISKIRPQAFCILFKAAPVWILALSKENTS